MTGDQYFVDETCQICGELVEVDLPHDRDRDTGRFLHRECSENN